jgi:hypothetical protein
MNDPATDAVARAAHHLREALPHLIHAADLMVLLEQQDKTPHEANIDLAIDMARVTLHSLHRRILSIPA